MTTNVFTTAGAKLYVSTTLPATVDAAGFNAITTVQWKEVGEIVDMGDGVGVTSNLVTHNPVGNRRTVKLKGTYNNGQMTLQMGRSLADEGQNILIASAEPDVNNISVKLVLDNPGTAEEFAFLGMVMSAPLNLGSADTVTGLSATIEINSDVFAL